MKKRKSLNNESTPNRQELYATAWVGALIRYCYYGGKRTFNTLYHYNKQEFRKNLIVSRIFYIGLLIIVVTLYAFLKH